MSIYLSLGGQEGGSPLKRALGRVHTRSVKALLNAGANPNFVDAVSSSLSL